MIDLNALLMVALNIHHLHNQLSVFCCFFFKFSIAHQLPLIYFLGHKLILKSIIFSPVFADAGARSPCPFVMSRSAAALLIPLPRVRRCRIGEQQEIILLCSTDG